MELAHDYKATNEDHLHKLEDHEDTLNDVVKPIQELNQKVIDF